MQSTDIPARFANFWGYNAGVGYIRNIPEDSQIGIESGAASIEDGFPPECFVPVGAGGTAPFGKDFNGILRWTTQWLRWASAGAPIFYDSTFAADSGGYPKGSVVQAGSWIAPGTVFYVSQADSETGNPETDAGSWKRYEFAGIATTGDIKWRPSTETIDGWVKANRTRIGNASSNATQLANARAYYLFKWLWEKFSNTQCQVYTSAGSGTTRGASADADWSANRSIEVLDMRGLVPVGVDTMGGAATTLLNGVPVTSGSPTTPGSVIGENLHVLTVAELAIHNHPITDPGHIHNILLRAFTTSGGTQIYQPIGGALAVLTNPNTESSQTGITVNNAGSNSAHNNMPLAMTGTWHIKL